MMNTSADVDTCDSRLAHDLGCSSHPEPRFADLFRRQTAGLALILLLLVMAVVIFAPLLPTQRFGYDEADYMYAASKGFSANYLDQGAIPVSAFLKQGVAGLKASNWSALSEYIRSSGDITFYRHYHGPLQFYALLVVMSIAGKVEKSIRLLGLASLLFCAAASYIGLLSTTRRHGALAGCLCALFMLVSPTNLGTAMWITPHTLYTAMAIITLFFLAKAVQTNCIRYLYASVVALAVAFTAIEYAALLLVTLAAVVWVCRKALFGRLSTQQAWLIVGKCALLFLLTIVIIWPGGIFKLTLVKDYLFFLYFTVVRSPVAYGTDSLASVWWMRLRSSPLEFAMVVICVAVFIKSSVRDRSLRFLFPFAIYALLVFGTTVRNRSLSSNYVSSLFPPLYVISAVVITRVLDKDRQAAYVTLAVVICSSAITGYMFSYAPLSKLRPDPVANGVVDVFNRVAVHNQKVFVPHDYLPTAHYYFPSNYYFPYAKSVRGDELLRIAEVTHAEGLLYFGTALQELLTELPATNPTASVLATSRVPDGAIAYVALR